MTLAREAFLENQNYATDPSQMYGWTGTRPVRVRSDIDGNLSTKIADGANLDAFSRLRTSTASYVFDGQFTYDLQPLLYERFATGSGASVAHDATNRCALMTFSASPNTSTAYMQTFEHFRYTAGRSQLCFITFNMRGAATNTLKFAGYSDGDNGIEFQQTATGKQFVLYSTSNNGNQTVAQESWNIDKLDGTGTSGITLDTSKVQILVIDFQALYVGRVRVGFDINGSIVYAHQFTHANIITSPYIQSANLPVSCGMYASGTATTTMEFICCSVIREDGNVSGEGYHFTQDSGVITAANGARTHALSIQPRLTFNSIVNRTKFLLENINIIVTGNSPVHWELCLGDAITGTTTFNDVNTTYSAFAYNTAGTTSGSPAIVFACGFVPASAQSKGTDRVTADIKFPICLDAAGAERVNGRMTLLVTGLGAASNCYTSITWKEIR